MLLPFYRHSRSRAQGARAGGPLCNSVSSSVGGKGAAARTVFNAASAGTGAFGLLRAQARASASVRHVSRLPAAALRERPALGRAVTPFCHSLVCFIFARLHINGDRTTLWHCACCLLTFYSKILTFFTFLYIALYKSESSHFDYFHFLVCVICFEALQLLVFHDALL